MTYDGVLKFLADKMSLVNNNYITGLIEKKLCDKTKTIK